MGKNDDTPLALTAKDVAPRTSKSVYPDHLAVLVEGRQKRVLGDKFGLSNFGVNLTRLAPGSQSSLMHSHSKQDEFVYILEGTPTLATDEGEVLLGPGDCAGFAAGGRAHHLINRSMADVVYLEIGDRTASDDARYPQDDLKATMTPEGRWKMTRKDGSDF